MWITLWQNSSQLKLDSVIEPVAPVKTRAERRFEEKKKPVFGRAGTAPAAALAEAADAVEVPEPDNPIVEDPIVEEKPCGSCDVGPGLLRCWKAAQQGVAMLHTTELLINYPLHMFIRIMKHAILYTHIFCILHTCG